MSRFDEQGELALARPPRQPGIPPELVRAKHSAGAAFTLAVMQVGLTTKRSTWPSISTPAPSAA